ncbi:HAUS augmin-like complex subunit 6 N-terminus domain containing protein [Naviculisporaceae sp. PSN 640]
MSTSFLSRTRSGRTPANTSGPARTPTRVTSTASTISSVSTVAPSTSSASASSSHASAASHISLFLTNLRLLDLDRHPEWPDINAQTFTAKDAAQGQKKRIQCVEWALYHLFTLWDHEEARNKLRPFFPPLDQVQSLNLRAALLRALEQAKKNGVLGRDAVVRKTMLDECKGERLAEVLAVFSSAVLKKLVAEQQLNSRSHPALAQSIALEHRGYTGERAELNALILAHKVSLHRLLDDKNAARARYKEFSGLLRLKEDAIDRRREQVEAARRVQEKGSGISQDRKLDLRRTVRNNWSGNEHWMETLLYGDSHGKKDGLLSTPFDRVWRRVQSGRLAELEDQSGGLLKQLDSRVQSQKTRLERWQCFRQEMFGKVTLETAKAETKPRPKEKGIDLGFRVHESLHLGRINSTKLARTKPSEFHGEYEEVIKGLEAQLAKLSQSNAQVPAFFQRPKEHFTATATSPEPEVISEISDIEDDFQPLADPGPVKQVEPVYEAPVRRTKTLRERVYSREEEPITASELRRSLTLQVRNSKLNGRRGRYDSPTTSPERGDNMTPPEESPSPSELTTPKPIRQAVTPERTSHTSITEQPPSLSPTQLAADNILASMNAVSPSPAKKRHTLSLAERTRLSMAARRTSQVALKLGEVDEDELEELDRLPIRRPPPPKISIEPAAPPSPERQVSPTRRRPRNGSVLGVETISEDREHDTFQTRSPEKEPGELSEEPEYEDLVSRTRRSMAGFEAARQKAQLERRRSQRKSRQATSTNGGRNGSSSYYPTRTPFDEDEEDGDLTITGGMDSTLLIAEELMSGEGQNDYDAVFMSRPKIKTSPVGTPTKYSGMWGD